MHLLRASMMGVANCCLFLLSAQDCPLPAHVRVLEEPEYDELNIRCPVDTLRYFIGRPRSIEIQEADFDEYFHDSPTAWRDLPDSLFWSTNKRRFTFDNAGRPTSFASGHSLDIDADSIVYGEHGPVRIIQPYFNITSTWKYDQKGLLIRKEVFMNGFITGWADYQYDEGRVIKRTQAGQHSPDTTRVEYAYTSGGTMREATELSKTGRSVFYLRPVAELDSVLTYYQDVDTLRSSAQVVKSSRDGGVVTMQYLDGRPNWREETRAGLLEKEVDDWIMKTFRYDQRKRLVRANADATRTDLAGTPSTLWENVSLRDFVYEYLDDDRGNPVRIVAWYYQHDSERRIVPYGPGLHKVWLFKYTYW